MNAPASIHAPPPSIILDPNTDTIHIELLAQMPRGQDCALTMDTLTALFPDLSEERLQEFILNQQADNEKAYSRATGSEENAEHRSSGSV